MNKTKIAALMVLMATGTMVFAAGNKKDAASIIEDITTFQSFTDEAVPQADIEKIVNAGVNAQSAINMQPWHFSVITNKEVLNEIGGKMKMPKAPPKGDVKGKGKGKGKEMDFPPAPPAGAPASGKKAGIADSPLVIIVSAKDGSELDAGLATELMTVEAVLLGYGTKIISSPTMVLNGEDKAYYQKVLGIPEDMSAKAILLVGKYEENQLDAVSSATTRKDKSEIVSYIK